MIIKARSNNPDPTATPIMIFTSVLLSLDDELEDGVSLEEEEEECDLVLLLLGGGGGEGLLPLL